MDEERERREKKEHDHLLCVCTLKIINPHDTCEPVDDARCLFHFVYELLCCKYYIEGKSKVGTVIVERTEHYSRQITLAFFPSLF